MSKAIPMIQKYMTTTPHILSAEASLEDAMQVMEKSHFRHIPVRLSAGHYGILTDRDVRKMMSFAGVNPKTSKVADFCEDSPFQVKPEDKLDHVAEVLAEKKLGSALVVDNGHLVGIFTLTDACRALSDVVRTRFHA